MLRAKLNRLSSKYDWAALFPECCLRHSAQRAPAAAAPTAHTSNTDKATLDKDVAGKKFIKSRVHIANEFYNAYNNIVFDNMLPCDTVITWNKRMLKKAGQAVLTTNRRDGSKTACIELSEKMLTDMDRLKNTLLHEMCHVATWLLDDFEIGAHRHHGPLFKKWAALVHDRVPEVVVNTYHSYEAHKPFHYQCSSITCNAKFKVHSKKGIDVTRHVCGICKTKLEYVGKFDVDGTMLKERGATAYSNFVKENFSAVKKRHSKLGNSELLKKIAELYKLSTEKNLV